MSRSAPIQVGDIVIGAKYRIERLIGEGGMGLVALGRHVELGHAVAIKVLRDYDDEATVKRFIREAKAVAQLASDHVIRVHDVGRLEDGAPYILMDFLEGEDLGAVVGRRALRVEEAADYVIQACEGIAAAHAIGVVHRDIKPQNLFLVRRPHQPPIVKVLDFGIAKTFPGTAQVTLTATNAIMGSPAYMSPEQMRGSHEVDARTDVWSLGVVLYELLTGATPFDGDTVADICACVLAHPPVPIAERRADVPMRIRDIIGRCLEKDVSKRLEDVAKLAAALEPFAPSASRAASERVRKILATHAASSVSAEAPATPSSAPASTGPNLTVMTPTAPASPSPAPQVRSVGTLASLESSVSPSRRRRFTFAAAFVVVSCVLGVVVVLGVGRPPPPVTTSTVTPPVVPPVNSAAASGALVGSLSAEPSAVAPTAARTATALAPPKPAAAAADAGAEPPSSKPSVGRKGSKPGPKPNWAADTF